MRRRGVLAALAASMGGMASLPTGTLATTQDSLGVNITETSSPVTGGEYLQVVVSVGNGATYEVTNTLELLDSSDTLLDSREVTLPGEATEIVTLGYVTYETQSDVTFPITVRSAGDADSTDVTVNAIDPDAGLGVSIAETLDPVTGGDYLEVQVSVGNYEPHEVTDTIQLLDSSDTVLDSREMTLYGESTKYTALGWETYPVTSTVEFPVTVRSSEDRDSEQVTVYGTG
ncbi:hypothetical protein [Natronoglomus mannanivorans]|uniref:CARDB protein n=1 Tax=Natronoglomus mannanivorans TaxID=2979990 RepID=A0AAP2Z060_9EURY|nr:hypothetical protein [Halobacteria archaeon AArc-xg1-1]